METPSAPTETTPREEAVRFLYIGPSGPEHFFTRLWREKAGEGITQPETVQEPVWYKHRSLGATFVDVTNAQFREMYYGDLEEKRGYPEEVIVLDDMLEDVDTPPPTSRRERRGRRVSAFEEQLRGIR